MQVHVEDLSSVKKTLHIEIPEGEVINELDKAYKKLNKTVKVKGFRPGKVPKSILEMNHKKEVHEDVSAKLIQNTLLNAIKETELEVLGNPEVEPTELKEKGPYSYDVTVEIKPSFDDINFKGLNLKRPKYKASDDEADLQIKMIQNGLSQFEPIKEDRCARKDDYVLIDFECFKDGNPFTEMKKTENFSLKIGEEKFTREFDDQLCGMKKGETKKINVTFPDEYANKKMANSEIVFEVLFKDIRKQIIPEVDSEFLKKIGNYENVESLKEDIMNNLKEGYEKRTEHELTEQAYVALLENLDFEIPNILINYELDSIVAEVEQSFAMKNASLENMGYTVESIKDKYRNVAIDQVKRHLVLDKIIKQEKLEISDEELEKGFKEMAETLKRPFEEIKEFYEKNVDKVEYFQQTLLEKNAIKLIFDNSNIVDVEPEEIIKLENADAKI